MTKVEFVYVKNVKWYAIFGRLIIFFEKMLGGIGASHCQVKVYNDVEYFTVESVWPRGRILFNDKSSKYKSVESFIFESDKSFKDILEFSRSKIEKKPYSLMQNIYLAWAGIIVDYFKFKIFKFLEQVEFNGRAKHNCSEAQLIIAEYLFNVTPTEGLDNYSVSEARNFIYQVYLLRGKKWQYFH